MQPRLGPSRRKDPNKKRHPAALRKSKWRQSMTGTQPEPLPSIANRTGLKGHLQLRSIRPTAAHAIWSGVAHIDAMHMHATVCKPKPINMETMMVLLMSQLLTPLAQWPGCFHATRNQSVAFLSNNKSDICLQNMQGVSGALRRPNERNKIDLDSRAGGESQVEDRHHGSRFAPRARSPQIGDPPGPAVQVVGFLYDLKPSNRELNMTATYCNTPRFETYAQHANSPCRNTLGCSRSLSYIF